MIEHTDMDPLAAHLERGWARLSAEDFVNARLSANAALTLAPDHPEALTLLGLAQLGDGDSETALQAFEAAMELDAEYLAPLLYWVEAVAQEPEHARDALERLTRAYVLVEPGSPEEVDIILLHTDLLLGLGEEESARGQLARLDPQKVREQDQRIQLGKLALQVEDLTLAEALLAPLRSKADLPSEGLYALAQLAEARGAFAAALGDYLRVWDQDVAGLSALRLPDVEELREEARLAMDRLPAELRPLMEGAEIRVKDLPPEELVADGLDPWMPLLLTGPPLPSDALTEGPRVFHLFLYRANLRTGSMDPDRRVALLSEHLAEALERFGE